jgi:uncharacterized protein (DUF305 family)
MNCALLQNKTINDKEFLKSMIYHHQVAVEMSKIINKLSNNVMILNISRNIIYNQAKEIYYMKILYIETKNSLNELNTDNKPLINTFKSDYPIIFENLKCDDSHFNFNHNNHTMSDLQYVQHMISHHNTALELSKLIIQSTKNFQILAFAQIININQSKEIFELYFLEKSLNT